MAAQRWVREVLLGEHSFVFLVELADAGEADRFRDACAANQWTTRVVEDAERRLPLAPADQAEVYRKLQLATRVWGRSFAPHQRPR
ncbi:hypothetical protein A8924_0915 [Saccharopolyspora erythraea NRRL 2338]|uniref:Uncharacterized protein n=2 Tax=Saccharopolyspora erythraea TaxID=1836 RepID=A4F739_SACEN|nr:hypothetical protein [Saccharopolyspora erythraea]EQD82881.1 hypothetical protein N599_28315 [Saccharopolyspora erythraea D]PFG93665.1 hypothetical protein A8924_0915 [Saccharopolyspora erythraea NRRL 2338]QRK90513.1 hypothetical protein JQX30_03135 [Saccharopolyspora erythraea]CAL99863.1 hypothetical protein SACE_0517 [Saccharopolyspora erythraea NRRL 2338]